MTVYDILRTTAKERVSDGVHIPVLVGDAPAERTLVLVWPQLGDFDSMEYAWWVKRDWERLQEENIAVRAVGIGDRAAGEKFAEFTGFPAENLWIDPTATLHRELQLYSGLTVDWPLLRPSQVAWVNLMLMCAGIASPGTLREVLRGYTGDRTAPQLIDDEETVDGTPLPPLKGAFFRWAGGSGFQRPFELATLRLRNMTEVLNHWSTYVPDAQYMTQRGGTFLFNSAGDLLYEYRDCGILGFAEDMSNPLSFLWGDSPTESNPVIDKTNQSSERPSSIV